MDTYFVNYWPLTSVTTLIFPKAKDFDLEGPIFSSTSESKRKTAIYELNESEIFGIIKTYNLLKLFEFYETKLPTQNKWIQFCGP